ncbi:hypothetical protein JOD25_003560 [Kurthia huakuii]|nr:hypothetical protein [Kurthia huakuii]MBM7701167.1 hypothetical protein [Kurthia huakuii]
MIPVEIVSFNADASLYNYHFFEENSTNTRKFFSINFYDSDFSSGEICYTFSYENGNMNIINFLRTKNIFYFFTSSIQHLKYFKKIIREMYSGIEEFKILKIPLGGNFELPSNIEKCEIIESNNILGLTMLITINRQSYIIKLYTNGVITFPSTNDSSVVKSFVEISYTILKHNED